MMKMLFDVVNFNSDASCLSSERWLKILTGKSDSELYLWLSLYVKYSKKVIIGFPGATLSDISIMNHEVIDLINDNPEIFQVILRPYSHDLASLRTTHGFLKNLDYGKRVIEKEFKVVSRFFLPPEFMITNEHIHLLQKNDICGIFIDPSRFSVDFKNRLPTIPYRIKGIHNSTLKCIPFQDGLTRKYLHALQLLDCESWNVHITNSDDDIYSWRDGESLFLLPDGLNREEFWLKNESCDIRRGHLDDSFSCPNASQLNPNYFKSYPLHSCSSWLKEFRMLGFLQRVNAFEINLESKDLEKIVLWLMAINSDILSSIEKKTPTVEIKDFASGDNYFWPIYRHEKWLEGEDFLALIEDLDRYLYNYEQVPAHLVKLNQRLRYLKNL